MCQQARADNLAIFIVKNQIAVSFSRVCPVIDNNFRQQCDENHAEQQDSTHEKLTSVVYFIDTKTKAGIQLIYFLIILITIPFHLSPLFVFTQKKPFRSFKMLKSGAKIKFVLCR